MEKLTLEATKSTPAVDFDQSERRFLMRGESYPEYAAKFYGPIYDWLNSYFATDEGGRPTTMDFELTYFNSSSSKALMNIFDILEDAAAKGKEVIVNWRFLKGNEAAQECGEEFCEDIEHVKFNLVEL